MHEVPKAFLEELLGLNLANFKQQGRQKFDNTCRSATDSRQVRVFGDSCEHF